MGTAKGFHRKLWRNMKDASRMCERVGLAGVNVFDCRNYTSPQHADEDCVRSLCAQILLNAEEKWSEFSFCATQYGYYIETRENTLWLVLSTLMTYFLNSTIIGALIHLNCMAQCFRRREQFYVYGEELDR